jgi:hypothetical protein
MASGVPTSALSISSPAFLYTHVIPIHPANETLVQLVTLSNAVQAQSPCSTDANVMPWPGQSRKRTQAHLTAYQALRAERDLLHHYSRNTSLIIGL